MLDYRMAEKFGLDWKQYDYKRMRAFIDIMVIESEEAEKGQKKDQQDKFRNRIR